MSRPHPECWCNNHYHHVTCLKPTGKACIEPDCDREAGTLWGPYWCPVCDVERLERIGASLKDMQKAYR